MSNQENIETVKENLLENAKISIQLGIEDYTMGRYNETRKISAIRNIFSGLLLLYKYKLILESPIDKPYFYIAKQYKDWENNNKFGIQEPKETVTTQQILSNFDKLSVHIDKGWFELVRKQRNNIEHFYLTQTIDISDFIQKCFNLIIDFYHKYLNQSNNDFSNFIGDKYFKILQEDKKNYELRKSECRATFNHINLYFYQGEDISDFKEKLIDILSCLKCSSSFIKYNPQKPDEKSLNCDYCFNEFSLDEALHISHKQILDEGDFRDECPLCGQWCIVCELCLNCGCKLDPNKDYERENYLNYLLEKDD